MPYADDARPTSHPDVLSRVLDGEAVLLQLDSGMYFGLNSVGSRTWQLIGDGKTVGEIRATLIDEFDVAPDTLTRDLDELLATLEARSLIRFA